VEKDIKTIIEQFVDYLLPELTPYETSVYLYLLGKSFIKSGTAEVRVGKRTIAAGYGKGSRGEKTNYAHISKILRRLEEKGCIKVGDTNREGTLYHVNLPQDIPLVVDKIANHSPSYIEEDYFSDPSKKGEIFERDKWICQYCGEKVTPENATLDHFIPQSKGGRHNKDNLKTCCLICNGIKAGKTYEETAPFLLERIRERKARSHR
jgi:5-methylcytosine-specific restriction endonuclease McrA